MPAAPIDRSYWVDPHVLAGPYPGLDGRLPALLGAGVTLFIDLTHPEDPLDPYEDDMRALSQGRARRVSLPIVDVCCPTAELVTHALQLIDEESRAGGITYVHCWGGIGRTGTVIGCLLAERLGSEAALDELARLRGDRISPETHEQAAFVRRWRGRGAG